MKTAVLVTVMLLASRSMGQCVGDCDRNGEVAIDDVVHSIRVALGEDIDACRIGDLNADNEITIDEVLSIVNSALSGCTPGCSYSFDQDTGDTACLYHGNLFRRAVTFETTPCVSGLEMYWYGDGHTVYLVFSSLDPVIAFVADATGPGRADAYGYLYGISPNLITWRGSKVRFNLYPSEVVSSPGGIVPFKVDGCSFNRFSFQFNDHVQLE